MVDMGASDYFKAVNKKFGSNGSLQIEAKGIKQWLWKKY
tara:strand:- start:491 stop:607 length:117 start_codon:yes stop_codon:yes gene_type:complete